MTDEEYRDYCLGLLADFARDLAARVEHLPELDPARELAAGFAELDTGLLRQAAGAGDLYGEGTSLVLRLFTTYPQLAPALPRDLLWFFGGDCLHYMPDEEIERYQELDARRLAARDRGETFNIRDARAKLLNLQ